MTAEKRSIFITGAASGIGKETAQFFAAKGWFVGLFDVNSEALDAAADDLPTDNFISCPLDVCDRSQWDHAIEQFTGQTGGRMTVFMNNAGIGEGGNFDDIPEEVQRRIVDVNLLGVMNGLNAALPVLKASVPSKIINIASAAAIYGPPRLAVYGATKAAVLSLSQSLEIELEDHGVGVSTIMPWYVDTPILDSTPYGSNQSGREGLMKDGIKIYPVSMVSEAVWKAVHSNRLNHTVGREAAAYRHLTRFFPGITRRLFRKMYVNAMALDNLAPNK